MRASEDIASALEAHGNAVWRACALYFRSSPDAEDAYQETFLKYALAEDARFNDEEHRKAWLVRVATNVCKDMLRAASRRCAPLDEGALDDSPAAPDPLCQPASFASDVVDVLRSLSDPPPHPGLSVPV